MKKGKPVSDLKDVLKAGIDPRKMPMNPENTPHSPPQSRRNQSVEGEERLRAQGVSRPVALINVSRPVEPDSTRPEVVPQTKEEMEASTKEWIRRARLQKQTPQPVTHGTAKRPRNPTNLNTRWQHRPREEDNQDKNNRTGQHGQKEERQGPSRATPGKSGLHQ